MTANETLLLGETDSETAVNVRAAFVALYGNPDGYVTHLFGRSFRRVSCPTDCKHRAPYSMTARHPHLIPYRTEEIGDAPDGHESICFECSGMTPPTGWSQEERRAYRAASAERPVVPLRVPKRGFAGSAGVTRGAKEAHRVARRDAEERRVGEIIAGARRVTG